MWYNNSMEQDQTQRTWSGLVFIAQLARLYAAPFFINNNWIQALHMAPNYINKKEVKVLSFFNAAVCRAFSFCFLFDNAYKRWYIGIFTRSILFVFFAIVSQLILNAIIKETNVRGAKMSEKNPFEIVDGQVILHNEFQGIDEVILNYEQVAAIKLLIQKYSDKGHDQSQLN